MGEENKTNPYKDLPEKISKGEVKPKEKDYKSLSKKKENTYYGYSPNELKGKYIKESVSPVRIYPQFKKNGSVDTNTAKRDFFKIIKSLAINEDKEFLEFCWNNRDKLGLKSRGKYTAILYGEDEVPVGKVEAYATAYEHGQEITNQLTDIEVSTNYNEFNKVVNMLEEELKKMGAGGVRVLKFSSNTNKKTQKISRVSLIYTIS